MPSLLDPSKIGHVAIGVMLTLLAMSVASVAISAERWWALRGAIRRSRADLGHLHTSLRKRDLDAVAAMAAEPANRRGPLAEILAAGVHEWQSWHEVDPDAGLLAARDALALATELSLADLRRGLSVLATIGSTAPFVGLFGTTFGIIHAFEAIAITGTSGITAIASGISEALITTAFGLFVAIPAVWAYNAFLGRLEVLRVELERGRYLLIANLARRT